MLMDMDCALKRASANDLGEDTLNSRKVIGMVINLAHVIAVFFSGMMFEVTFVQHVHFESSSEVATFLKKNYEAWLFLCVFLLVITILQYFYLRKILKTDKKG